MLTHLTISVSHHGGFRLVHPTMWSLINAICHQDGCRLVYPVKWDISSMSYTIITHADWCIPPSETLDNFGFAFMTDSVGESRHVSRSVYRFNLRCQELTNSFIIQLITHKKLIVKHFKYHIFKSICTFVISFQRYTHSI